MCACFCFRKHPAGVGTAAGILSQDGQVCHLNTDGDPEIPGVAGRAGWEGKTIALCTWTTPLCKVLPQMIFPLSLVTAREVGTTEPCQTGTTLKCTQVVLPS